MRIEVRNDDVFSVNGLGLDGTPFPLTFSVRGAGSCATARHDRPVLPALPGCCLGYSGHDDCYVWVETTERQAAAAILARLLALLVGSALPDTGVTAVMEPAAGLVQDLLQQSSDWVGTVGAASAQAVAVNLAATSGPWRPDRLLPAEIGRVAVYDIEEACWHLAAP